MTESGATARTFTKSTPCIVQFRQILAIVSIFYLFLLKIALLLHLGIDLFAPLVSQLVILSESLLAILPLERFTTSTITGTSDFGVVVSHARIPDRQERQCVNLSIVL